MSFEAGFIEDDALVLTPALVLSVGRCECCEKPAALMISLDWLRFHVAVVVPFFINSGH